MAAKAIVPGEALPWHPPLSGAWASPTSRAKASYARVPNSRLGGAPSVRVTMAVKALALA